MSSPNRRVCFAPRSPADTPRRCPPLADRVAHAVRVSRSRTTGCRSRYAGSTGYSTTAPESSRRSSSARSARIEISPHRVPVSIRRLHRLLDHHDAPPVDRVAHGVRVSRSRPTGCRSRYAGSTGYSTTAPESSRRSSSARSARTEIPHNSPCRGRPRCPSLPDGFIAHFLNGCVHGHPIPPPAASRWWYAIHVHPRMRGSLLLRREYP